MHDLGSLGESTLMRVAMDSDVAMAVGCSASTNDPDATVDLQPASSTLSNKRTSFDKTLSAAKASRQAASFMEDQRDDTRDITTDVGDGMALLLFLFLADISV